MARYTMKDKNGRYYIESANGKLESDIKGHTYGEAIGRFAEYENADVVPRSEYDDLKFQFNELDIECDRLEDVEKQYDKLKSEVERLREELEKERVWANSMIDNLRDDIRELQKAKQEVAREMINEFEELVELSKIAGVYADIVIKNGIAELKKKHIGE